MDDDDDWTGTPPEGRHPRSMADPAHWARQWQPAIVGATLFVAFVVIALLALL
jgi:hypothetical protein